MKKCSVCHGQKHINGMGNMREKCKACEGKGFLADAKPIEVIVPATKKKKEIENGKHP